MKNKKNSTQIKTCMERTNIIYYLVCNNTVECEGALTVDSVLAYQFPPVRCHLLLLFECIRHPLVYNFLVARLLGG